MSRRGIAASILCLAYVGMSIWDISAHPTAHAPTPTAAQHLPRQVRPILTRSCFDCHSAETQWPWYSKVVPFSWIVRRDVEQARTKLDFSEWYVGGRLPTASQIEEVCDAASDDSMPPWQYRLLHPGAKLTHSEGDMVCGWSGEDLRVQNAGTSASTP